MKKLILLFSTLTIPTFSTSVLSVISYSKNKPEPYIMMVDHTYNLIFTADWTLIN